MISEDSILKKIGYILLFLIIVHFFNFKLYEMLKKYEFNEKMVWQIIEYQNKKYEIYFKKSGINENKTPPYITVWSNNKKIINKQENSNLNSEINIYNNHKYLARNIKFLISKNYSYTTKSSNNIFISSGFISGEKSDHHFTISNSIFNLKNPKSFKLNLKNKFYAYIFLSTTLLILYLLTITKNIKNIKIKIPLYFSGVLLAYFYIYRISYIYVMLF